MMPVVDIASSLVNRQEDMNMTSEPKTSKTSAVNQPKPAKAEPMRSGDELSKEALDKATGGLLPAVGPQK
jgi:hypothetical protein